MPNSRNETHLQGIIILDNYFDEFNYHDCLQARLLERINLTIEKRKALCLENI